MVQVILFVHLWDHLGQHRNPEFGCKWHWSHRKLYTPGEIIEAGQAQKICVPDRHRIVNLVLHWDKTCFLTYLLPSRDTSHNQFELGQYIRYKLLPTIALRLTIHMIQSNWFWEFNYMCVFAAHAWAIWSHGLENVISQASQEVCKHKHRYLCFLAELKFGILAEASSRYRRFSMR